MCGTRALVKLYSHFAVRRYSHLAVRRYLSVNNAESSKFAGDHTQN
jgi:hypothetical protein